MERFALQSTDQLSQISIEESTHSLDGEMIAKALGDENASATELKSYTSINNAKRLLEDSADAHLTHSQNEGDFTFTITFWFSLWRANHLKDGA